MVPENDFAQTCWIASTSATWNNNQLWVVNSGTGYMQTIRYDQYGGFRPIICLNTKVSLEETNGEYNIVK